MCIGALWPRRKVADGCVWDRVLWGGGVGRGGVVRGVGGGGRWSGGGVAGEEGSRVL